MDVPHQVETTPRWRATVGSALARAALLAVVVLPLSAATAHAGPITCSFSDPDEGGEFYFTAFEGPGCIQSSSTKARFDWGAYFVELTFFGVKGSFDIMVNDVEMTQEEFANRLEPDDEGPGDEEPGDFELLAHSSNTSAPGPVTPPPGPGYSCVPMVDPVTGAAHCRDFVVTAPPREFGPGQYHWSNYLLKIAWLYNSDPAYPGDTGRVRILHNLGGTSDRYDVDMCLDATNSGSAYVPCTYVADLAGDPFISSGDTDFSSFAVAFAPVPEAASLLLFGCGIAEMARRRYRNRR